MLVKVNEAYRGVYGLFDRATGTVRPKRAGDAPFEVERPERHIENGVLIAVLGGDEEEERKEVVIETTSMTYPQLQEAAKRRGIAYVGKTKEALRELIAASEAMEGAVAPPVLTAEDPVL